MVQNEKERISEQTKSNGKAIEGVCEGAEADRGSIEVGILYSGKTFCKVQFIELQCNWLYYSNSHMGYNRYQRMKEANFSVENVISYFTLFMITREMPANA